MAHYIDSEKLKAEIERRLQILEKYKDTHESAAAARQELIWMKDFIESQEEESEKVASWEDWYQKGLYDGHKSGFADAMKQTEEILRKQAHPVVFLKDSDNSPKIKGWVARDKDGTLLFGRKHPDRIRSSGTWMGFGKCMEIDRELYPDICWEDDPIEVELIIREVK